MDRTVPDLMADIPLFWTEVGFEPWSWNGFAGMRRRVTFRKGSMLGEVARYFADDYIVWQTPATDGEKRILADWRPADEVMSHRFLLLGSRGAAKPSKRFFLLGIRGWVEVLPYRLGDPEVEKFRDLVFIVNKAWDFARKTKGGMPATKEE